MSNFSDRDIAQVVYQIKMENQPYFGPHRPGLTPKDLEISEETQAIVLQAVNVYNHFKGYNRKNED